jgi:hypothetical protein
MQAKRKNVSKIVCPFDQVNTAYLRGKRDKLCGKTLLDNPYPNGGILQRRVKAGWVRGFMSANKVDHDASDTSKRKK